MKIYKIETYVVKFFVTPINDWIVVGTAFDIDEALKIEKLFRQTMKEHWKSALTTGIVKVVEESI